MGIEVESHGAVTRMLGLHFVKPGRLPARVTRHLGNLYERRHTAEYSPRAAWEFTGEELYAYLGWVKSSSKDMLRVLKDLAPALSGSISSLEKKLEKSGPPSDEEDG